MHLTSIMNESNKKDAQPGEGIRSLATSRIFRAANFELYAKPVSFLVLLRPTVCIGFIYTCILLIIELLFMLLAV